MISRFEVLEYLGPDEIVADQSEPWNEKLLLMLLLCEAKRSSSEPQCSRVDRNLQFNDSLGFQKLLVSISLHLLHIEFLKADLIFRPCISFASALACFNMKRGQYLIGGRRVYQHSFQRRVENCLNALKSHYNVTQASVCS